MSWTNLKNIEFSKIYYSSNYGGKGSFYKEYNFHLIEEGQVFIELTNGNLYELYDDSEIEGLGLHIQQVPQANLSLIQEYQISDYDEIWSKISKKIMVDFKIYKGHSFIEIANGKTQKKEFNLTIELIFLNGEQVFISTAGFLDENLVMEKSEDLILYRKKTVGEKYNLLN